MPATEVEVSCPKCGGKTWDNRLTKKNPKAPDYKCRDKACDGCVWPPKGAKASATKAQPVSHGPLMPWEEEQNEAEEAFIARTKPDGKLAGLFATYDQCFAHAMIVADKGSLVLPLDGHDVAAIAATLFIQASKV